MTIYNVIHHYDVDGGFGDAIRNTELLFSFASEADANAFVEQYALPHVWDTPYDNLQCGILTIEPCQVIDAGEKVEFDQRSFSPWGSRFDRYWEKLDYPDEEDTDE